MNPRDKTEHQNPLDSSPMTACDLTPYNAQESEGRMCGASIHQNKAPDTIPIGHKKTSSPDHTNAAESISIISKAAVKPIPNPTKQ